MLSCAGTKEVVRDSCVAFRKFHPSAGTSKPLQRVAEDIKREIEILKAFQTDKLERTIKELDKSADLIAEASFAMRWTRDEKEQALTNNRVWDALCTSKTKGAGQKISPWWLF